MSENLVLPGISSSYLADAEVCHVDADTSQKLCGIQQPGISFPYFNYFGERVEDGDKDFVRLRLDQPRGTQKYHQQSGTGPHAYLPPAIWGKNKTLESPVFIVEGEKKALALAEEGFTAVGIGGFYNFRGRDGALVTELADVLGYIRQPFFIFLGDRDVIYNYQFSHAAWTFAQLVSPAPVLAACVPLDAPGKGFDDCRHALGGRFKGWFVDRVYAGAVIKPESAPGSVALELVQLQTQQLGKLVGPGRDEAARGLSKLAAGLHGYPLEQQGVIDIAVEKLGLGRQVFKRMVNEAREKVAADLLVADLGGEAAVISLGEQPGVWTRGVLEIVGPQTYFFGGNLCDLNEGKFIAHTSASLVPMVDAPSCCRFTRPGPMRQTVSTHLTEKDSRLLLGALRQHADVLQPVETLAHVPALVWSTSGPQLVTGYSREHRVLAATGIVDLPKPEDAATKILEVVKDFDFVTPGDAGRAVAMVITSAMTRGRFLDSGRAPFFMVEKDQKGAGAGTFVRMLAAIYAFQACSITPEDPKAAREDVSKHLLEGAGFIYFDNIRGKVLTTLPFLESLLTEPMFTCRAPYVHGTVDVSRGVIACTSNGAVLSPDLADRTVKITLRKQPPNYSYHRWPEGDLIDHVAANRLEYLAAVYSLVQAWGLAGRPDGSQLTGFRFRQWERACAWILETYFAPLPLLDRDHAAAQQRLANPDFDLLRSLFRAVLEAGETGTLTATSLARHGIETGRLDGDEKAAALKVGRALTQEFSSEGSFDFANEFRVVRRDAAGSETNYEKLKTYWISPLPGKTVALVSLPRSATSCPGITSESGPTVRSHLRLPPVEQLVAS